MKKLSKKDFVLDIIKTANKVYSDGLVLRSFKREQVGDGLAEFIAGEIEEVGGGDWTEKEAYDAVNKALTCAALELDAVIDAIRKEAIKL